MSSSSSSADPLVAVVQMCSTNDKAHNLATATRLVEAGARQGAKLVALPECCNFFGLDTDESVAAAEPLDGLGIGSYAALAKSCSVWLSMGGIKVVSEDPARPTNSHVLISPEGAVAAVYNKVHLFNVELPGTVLKESGYTMAGKELVCAATSIGRIGLSTCYDLRFPALYASLVRAGAEIMLVPAAWTVKTFPHWEVLLRARAIETQSYVVAAAQVGKHNEKRTSPGGACIVDPWGTVLARCGAGKEGVAVAPVDRSFLQGLRRNMPVVSHMQPDVYAGAVSVVHHKS